MIATSLVEISRALSDKALPAELVFTAEDKIDGKTDLAIESVSTDSRNIDPAGLFIALIGEKFDAHDFCQQAKDNGAVALLVARKLDIDLPQIIVSDTRLALGALAAWVHQQCNIRTLAITGSCGKTTVKEMVAAILEQKGRVLATAGNFNNDIGVPLTLLRSTVQHDYAVIELGANHLDEIAYTTQLVKPTVALVNNVAAAHLEGFGSIDGVKKAKGEIYQGLPDGGVAIVNANSNGGELWDRELTNKRVITFSAESPLQQEVNEDQFIKADYYPADIELNTQGYASFKMHTPNGNVCIDLAVVGKHNIANALAAAALAIEFGADLSDVQAGLARVKNVKGRVEVEQLSETVRLIDDSYNASVPAMHAAVDLLATYGGERWLVLGYMAELGRESLALHRQLGEYAAQFEFEHVVTYGSETKVISDICSGQHFYTHTELITYIEQQLQQSASHSHTLLVKGANSAGMSKVAEALKEKHQ